MEAPPEFLDGARVLKYANLAEVTPTGATRHFVDGREITDFAALAVTRYDEEPSGVYLFYCDPTWRVITDTWHEDVEAAERQAGFEFGLLHFEDA